MRFVIDIICAPLGLGMQVVCSRYIGKMEINRAQKTFSGSFTLGLLLSTVVMAIGFTRPAAFSFLYGRGDPGTEVLALADAYVKGLFTGVPAQVIFGVLAPIVQLGSGKKGSRLVSFYR